MQARRPQYAAARMFVTLLCAFSAVAAIPSLLSAQAVTFSYATTTLPTLFGFTAGAVGVDGAGNVYIASSSAGSLFKVPAGGGLPVSLTNVPAAVVAGGQFMTVDSAGNAFYIYQDQVLRYPAAGGSATVVGNFVSPGAVALDGNGNVFVIDCGSTTQTCNTTIWKLPSDGDGPQTAVTVSLPGSQIFSNVLAVDKADDLFVRTIHADFQELPANGGAAVTLNTYYTSGTRSPNSVAADAAGDLFVAPVQTSHMYTSIGEYFAGGSGGLSIPIMDYEPGTNNLESGFPTGVAVDSHGTAYIAYGSGVEVVQAVNAAPNFQNVNYCAAGQIRTPLCSATATLTYNVNANTTLGTPVVLNSGSSSDFTLGSGLCNGSLTAGNTCYISVNFTPQAYGLRTGAVQIVDNNGNVITTTSISGIGVNLGLLPFVTAQSPGPVRNNYSGEVGFQFTVGTAPIQLYSLGFLVSSQTQSSASVKLVQQNGADMPGGALQVAGYYDGALTAPFYAYGNFAQPITLQAGSSYFLVAAETAGGASWFDFGPVTSTSVATVNGPTYTDTSSRYVTASGLSGDAFVPLNFLYTSAASSAISVSITSPAPGATASGATTVTVSTTGAVATLQLQVDGTNAGAAVPVSSTLSLDTTTLTNGSHMLTVVAADAQSHTVASAPVSITVSNVSANSSAFVTSQTLGPLRNNYAGFVGLALTVGTSPITVSSLGRYVAPANSGTHLLKLVSSNGTDVAGGSASVSLAGSQPGGYAYAALPAPLTLQPNTSYFLVSAETAGGDQWYDFAPVSTSTIASVTAPVYTDAGGHYVAATFASGDSYVPVNLRYQTLASTLSVTITSPATGATVSGNNTSVTISTSGTYTGLQLQVDGVNQGSSVSASPLTLNTLSLSNGSHTLTVVAAGGGTTAVSSGVTINVSNGSTGTFTSFITGETPSTLRNNYSGYVGTEIKVGATPLSVVSLGRFFVSGNSGAHVVKLVQANGSDVPGASVSVVMPGGTPGQFVYAFLASPITLAANTSYFLVSQETVGGDYWYDLEPVNSTAAAQVLGATYTDAHGLYVFVGGLPSYSYVPLSFQYQ